VLAGGRYTTLAARDAELVAAPAYSEAASRAIAGSL
jgi:hypothetical protein